MAIFPIGVKRCLCHWESDDFILIKIGSLFKLGICTKSTVRSLFSGREQFSFHVPLPLLKLHNVIFSSIIE